MSATMTFKSQYFACLLVDSELKIFYKTFVAFINTSSKLPVLIQLTVAFI